MTQLSRVRAESQRQGAKRLIDLGALAASGYTQYGRDHADLRVTNRTYGAHNFITVINNSTVNIAVDLDYTTAKRYIVPASSMISVDMVMYQEFSVTNLSASTGVAAGEVYLTIGYERQLLREAR